MNTLQILLDLFASYGYVAVFFVLLICGFGVPIPEDITLVAGGVISGLEYTNVHYMFFVGMLGVLAGDSVMFLGGRFLGTKILNFRMISRLLPPKRFAIVQEKFEKYDYWVIFLARFMPGLRSPIFVTAGMTRRVPYWKFFLIDGFAALISVPVWVYLGYYGAANRDWLIKMIHRGQMGILVALALIVVVIGYVWWKRRKKRLSSNEN